MNIISRVSKELLVKQKCNGERGAIIVRVGETVQLHLFLGSCRKAFLTSCCPFLSVPEISASFLLTPSSSHCLVGLPP